MSSERAVCPRCGTDAESHRFCPTCGLVLAEQDELPTRAEWEARVAATPWPGAEPSADPAAGVRDDDRAPARPRSRLRSLIEVGAPLLAIAAVAIVVFSHHGSSGTAGALHYDARAKPLMNSLRSARQDALSGACRGCASVQSNAGGCSGYATDWTCDVHISQSRRDPSLVPGSTLVETYKVTWNHDGCWTASADCVSESRSSGKLCPPPHPAFLRGCIGS